MRRLLVKSVYVISVDPDIGNVSDCDILIEDGIIRAIQPNLGASGAETIDGRDLIACPGFVDTHHHMWQSVVRGIASDWSIGDYVSGMRLFVASAYRPEDIHIAQKSAALQALNFGVTTTADYCHNLNSPDHAEEAIRGLRESGARIVWCYGFNRPPLPAPAFADLKSRCTYLEGIAAAHFSSADGLVTLGVAPEETPFWADDDAGSTQFRAAREVGARLFWHANSTKDAVSGKPRRDVARVHARGLLGPDLTLVHMNHSDDEEWNWVREQGGHLSITPETEMQMGMGWPALGAAERHDVNVSLGVDIISNNSADLRFQIRLLLQAERWKRSQEAEGRWHSGVPISARQALYWGTMGGAKALGLGDRIGSLTPGKKADIVFFNTGDIGLAGWDRSQPEALVIMQGDASSISSVLVDGVFVKRDGELVSNVADVTRRVEMSRDYILGEVDRLGGIKRALSENLGTHVRADADRAKILP